MRVSVPRYQNTLLEYRLALDAAASLLGGAQNPITIIHPLPLVSEVRQRFPAQTDGKTPSHGCLWVEPQVGRWQDDLEVFETGLTSGAVCVVLVSSPLARLIPERVGWGDHPLGWRPAGLSRLRSALLESGFNLQSACGFHTVASIFINSLSSFAARLDRPDWQDRLLAAGRRCYTSDRSGWLATLTLLAATKVSGSA